MTVTATVSKTLTGAGVSDLLTGGSSGYNWGESETGDDDPTQFAFFLKHDGAASITNLAFNVQPMSGAYGGDYSPSADLAKLVGNGDDGYGMQWDLRWDGSPLFGVYTTITSAVGASFATRIVVPVGAMSRNNAGTEVDASAPVAGQVGEATNSALGDRAHMTMRILTPAVETQTGRRQVDVYYSYNFTL